MKMVMVLTQQTRNEENDRQRAAEYCRFAAHKGLLPVSPYLSFHGLFQDELGGIVEHLMSRNLARKVDEIWVFGSEKDDRDSYRIQQACRGFEDKIKYFDIAEIGERMLMCAMYTEELIERLEEMEG
ncbi:MAG: hypothetical protein ACLUFH_03135 [Monoglobales bacterium]